MLFNSYAFALFFPLVTLLYFGLPDRRRWMLLLPASCFFYAYAIPRYLPILLALVLLDYVAARAIEPAQGSRRRAFLVLSLLANLGLLGAFKYSSWVLPIGLSFHTFQSMSYTIEVYRGRWPAERNLARYALYVLFYPQLVAGPIERPQHLLPQFRQPHPFDYDRVVRGLQLMAWGLFKKVAVADRLGAIVNPVYQYPQACVGPPLALATLFFGVQIYCDFSGYTDIARGAAEVMGYDLRENFRRPYFASTLTEFWRRWHISLSSWFRDYVYLPLGGNRGSGARVALHVMIVFGLSGIWHGARWTFLIWGLVHGLALLAQRRWLKERPGWPGRLTTLAVVMLAWIPFRVDRTETLWVVLERLQLGWAELGQGPIFNVVNLQPVEWWGTAFTVLVLLVVECLQEAGLDRGWLAGQTALCRWAVYYALVGGIFLFCSSNNQPFLYFQF